ncbi:hypothetical protein N7468_010369 [Penicillium chermesinum]|uniref:C2H2-type domain-containing protein n=1 Tax=Penicillium chermesinum TaxID=63820 RepID=A0A9W9NCJ9_9EURO|nr:uncharacterized protein N7468_010369 [Penicillium chermesinum]KAJ5217361.1 hypothetical protein N7468_010369 [Penicillium chermesinum]
MDKHERPYTCKDWEQVFTYSGYLSRHQREVHKNNKMGSPITCPHGGRDRSVGNGSTRRASIQEHLRRRHVPDTNAKAGLRVEVSQLRREALEKGRRIEELERRYGGRRV